MSRAQVQNLGLSSRFATIDYLSGPCEERDPADQATADFTQGPYYSWVRKDVPQATAEGDIKAALQHVVAHVARQGKYDCVYGFSTGGAVAALLSMTEVLDALGASQLWDSVIIACGADPAFQSRAEQALGVQLTRGALSMPSFHIIALEDRFKPESEEWMLHFEPAARHVHYISGGHSVPRELRRDRDFQSELQYWYSLHVNSPLASPLHRHRSARSVDSMKSERSARCDSRQAASNTLQKTLARLDSTESTLAAPGGGRLAVYEGGRAVVLCEPPGTMTAFSLSVFDFISAAPRQAEFCRAHGQASLTYGALLAFIQGAGDARRLGVRSPLDVVVYPASQGPAAAVAMLAISCRACAVPLDPGAIKLDVASALEQFNPQVLVAFRGTAAQGFEAAVADLPKYRGAAIAWCATALDGPSGLYKVEHDALDHFEIDAGPQILLNPAPSNAMLLRTSGTTSKPKIVPLRAGALTSNAAVLAGSLGLRRDDCCINAMPLFHIGGLSCSILATIAAGASVTCMPKFDAQTFLDILTSGAPQPTWYSTVPTIHLAVLNHAASLNDGKAPASHRLRFIRTGAAALSQFDAVKLMDFWGVPVIPTYSMSEQMPISGSPMEVTWEVLDGVGMPLCCSLAVVREGTAQPVLFKEVGEVCISGPNVMSEYQDNTEANSKSYFYIGAKRFFRTGDVGTIDSQGILRLVGRSKELIKRGGEQVSPLEVEAILNTHPDVEKALVFAVPSVTWGEEVGAALSLSEDAAARVEAGGKKVQDEIITAVRSHALGMLNIGSVPAHWKIVQDSELPKTSTGKYIRTGLARVLGMEAKEMTAPMQRPPVVSSGLNGLRWIMVAGVMFNHIGSATEEEYSYGPVFGEFKSSTFFFPTTVFFVLGGFSLSAALSARPATSWRKFYAARMQTLHPEYLFALLLALVNLLIACPPGDFSEKFTFQREGDDLTCQSGALVVPYGLSMVFSLFVFGFGLQAWPWFIPLTQWILYYSWFCSVYYFIIATFPPLHNALVRIRGRRVELWVCFGLTSALVYATCVPLACFYLLPEWTKASSTDAAGSWGWNAQNIYALATVIFPPYWLPSSLAGMVAYFLYDALRPSQTHRVRQFGFLCDFLSAAFLAWHIRMAADVNWPYPDFANDRNENLGQDHNSGIERYMWSVLSTRLKVPLIALWIILLAMPGRSYTARFFELPLMAETLGPTAYGCFLHHQTVGQWYFWATRGVTWDWWSFRKSYYWFSPKPMPGATYEYFFVVVLVTMFSMLVKAYVTPYILLAWNWLLAGIGRLTGKGGDRFSAELTSLELINEALEELVGGSVALTEDSTLEESGLGSIGLPALVATLDSLDERLHMVVADIAKLENIGELARLIDEKRKNAGMNAGVGPL